MDHIYSTTFSINQINQTTTTLQSIVSHNETISVKQTRPLDLHLNITTSSSTGTPNTPVFQNGSLETTTVIPSAPSELLDKDLAQLLTFILIYALQIPVTFCGIVSNILNIVIFKLSGLKDSITLTFIALSISDLLYSVIYLICNMMGLLGNELEIQSDVIILGYLGLGHYLSNYIFLAQDVSIIITVFVAVQKCCCVVLPHLFKSFFSRRRTIAILICLSGAILVSYIPIISALSFKTVPISPGSNDSDSIVMLDYGQEYLDRVQVWRYFNRLFLPTFSQVIIVVCLFVMRWQLKKSVVFRYGDRSAKLGKRETRAITAVAIVIIIFFVSSLPSTLLTYCTLIAKDFFDDPRNYRLRAFLDHSYSLLIQISASVNIFVYLKYNTKYRNTARGTFKRTLSRTLTDSESTDPG